MDARGYRLGVDFGTSNTVAMLAWPGGQARPLLFDGSPALPSAVYADPSAGLMVGRDAVHAARVSPERFEPNPKRRIDEPGVLLGDVEIGIVDLIAAVLGRVATEARRVAGGAIGPTTLTYPAAWAQTRRGILVAAAERAGLGQVSLVPEPVAAAGVFVALNDTTARPGNAFVVYDLGAGTFDASVVRRIDGGFEVLATEGLSQSGGLDIDAAIVGYLGAVYSARDPNLWVRLQRPTTSADRRANRLLWEDVRAAKEMLSRASTTMIHIPLADEDAPLGRDQFEQLARPILDATVTATRAAIGAAGVGPAGIFLVGGGSRIPLVATLLHQAFGLAPTVVEQPELVVAQGSVGAADALGAAPVSGGFSAGPVSGGFSAGPASGPVSGPVSGGFSAGSVSGPPATVYGSASVPGPVSGSPSGSAAPPVSGPPAGPVSGPSGGQVSGAPVGPVSGPAWSGPSVSGPPAWGSPGNPMSAPPGGPVSGPPVSGPPVSGPPVSGPPGSRSPAGWAPGPAAVPGPPAGHPHPPGRASAAGAPKRRGVLIAAVAVVVLLVLGVGGYALRSALGGDGGDSGNSADGNTGDDSGEGSDPSDGAGPPTADVHQPDPGWTTTAGEYEGMAGKTIAYNCPPDGSIGTVWGVEPYTTDSAVCTAAVHAGRISLADGGWVVIEIRAGESSYQGSEQYGIVTTAYDAYPWCFVFVG